MTTFTPKDWRNATTHEGGGDETTPLSAAAIEDLEIRVTGYADIKTAISVKEYGAVGNGVAEDGAAFRDAYAAVVAAGGGTVLVPPGVYVIDDGSYESVFQIARDNSRVNSRIVLSGYGATIRLTSNTPRFIDFARVADHDIFRNHAIVGFDIDADDIDTGANSPHIIIGTYDGAGSTLRRTNFEDLTLQDLYAYNVITSAPGAGGRYAIKLMTYQTGAGEGTQNWIKRIHVKNVRVDGGNSAVTIAGAGPGTNVFLDEIVVEGVRHDYGSILDATWGANHIHIGSYGFGGSVVVRDCWGYGCPDAAVEINNMTDALVENVTLKELNGFGFYFTNFNYPASEGTGVPSASNNTLDHQKVTFRDCQIEVLSAPIVESGGNGYMAATEGIGLGEMVVENCSYYRNTAEFGRARECVFFNAPLRKGVIRGGRFVIDGMNVPAGGGESTAQALVGINNSVDELIIRDCYLKAVGTKDVAAVAHGLTAIELRGITGIIVKSLLIDNVGLDLDLTRFSVYGINIGYGNASTFEGTVRRLNALGAAGSSSDWTGALVGTGTALTIPTKLRFIEIDFTGYPSGATDFTIAAANLPDVEVINSQGRQTNSVASAAGGTITLPHTHNFVTITGTNNTTAITPSWEERPATLAFAGSATFTDGSNLALAGNFVHTPNDTISLVCNGTSWYETGRSVN